MVITPTIIFHHKETTFILIPPNETVPESFKKKNVLKSNAIDYSRLVDILLGLDKRSFDVFFSVEQPFFLELSSMLTITFLEKIAFHIYKGISRMYLLLQQKYSFRLQTSC